MNTIQELIELWERYRNYLADTINDRNNLYEVKREVVLDFGEFMDWLVEENKKS